jgi:hypothetical protein
MRFPFLTCATCSIALGLVLAGCTPEGTTAARERLTSFGQAVQGGGNSARQSLEELGEATKERTEVARERLVRAGERVLDAKAALGRLAQEPPAEERAESRP